LKKDEKKQRYFGEKFDTRRYFGARKSLILEDILVQEKV